MTIIGLLGLITIPGVLTSCISDAVTTSPHDVLTFSRDTVSFDTVFTGLGTPTARLIVSNRAKKGLNISSIRFKNPDSKFRMNVDGQSGSDFRDVEIRGKDSIYVFIECYIPETPGNEPTLVEDELEFVTNGVTQSVLCEAWGQNVTRLRGVTIAKDMRFTDERPYVVFDSLVVAENARLSIDPGVKLLFHDKAYMRVHGTLDAQGEPGRMIDMRGDRLDNVLPDVEYDIMAGQWGGIRIGAKSFHNRMAYVNMRSTVYGIVADSCADISRPKLSLLNSWLHNSQGNVLTVPYGKVDAVGTCFSEAAGATIWLAGGEHSFLQCTFANNYLFSAISEPLVVLKDVIPEDEGNTGSPLMKAEFRNCILYGIPSDINVEDLAGSNAYFRYCSFKATGSDDDNFLNCLWDTDPMFLTNRLEYYFNYRLANDSPVKASGNPEFVTAEAMIDMDGVDRLASGQPSLGAYQYVPVPEDTPPSGAKQ